MDMPTISYVMAAYAAAAFLKGVAGLGFSTICLGILAAFVDIRLAIPLVILPSVGSNILVMIEAGQFRATLRRFRWLYASLLPGLAIGLSLLATTDTAILTRVLAVVLLLYGLYGLVNRPCVLSATAVRLLAAPTGLLTGFINGMTGAQTMPVVPYLMTHDLSKQEFVQALNISFTLSSAVMLAGLGTLGLLERDAVLLSAAGILPVAALVALGTTIRRRLSNEQFRRVVHFVLVLLGLNLLQS